MKGQLLTNGFVDYVSFSVSPHIQFWEKAMPSNIPTDFCDDGVKIRGVWHFWHQVYGHNREGYYRFEADRNNFFTAKKG